MQKTTKIIIALEAVAILFLLAAIVIGIIKSQWLNVGSNIIWIGISVVLLVVVVRNDKTLQEKEALMAKNADLREENDILRSTNRWLEAKSENRESGNKTVHWFKDRFVELALQMDKHHGVANEIRISPLYHTKKVEIDF